MAVGGRTVGDDQMGRDALWKGICMPFKVSNSESFTGFSSD